MSNKGLRHHGFSRSKTYQSWLNMKKRCNLPSNKAYKHYGGRGIAVCERWNKFENFLADMGERPDGMTLDRYPDNDGNYEPSNCRWATSSQQHRNTRVCHYITVNGVTKSSAEWEETSAVGRGCVIRRIARGMSPEDAIALPPRPGKRISSRISTLAGTKDK